MRALTRSCDLVARADARRAAPSASRRRRPRSRSRRRRAPAGARSVVAASPWMTPLIGHARAGEHVDPDARGARDATAMASAASPSLRKHVDPERHRRRRRAHGERARRHRARPSPPAPVPRRTARRRSSRHRRRRTRPRRGRSRRSRRARAHVARRRARSRAPGQRRQMNDADETSRAHGVSSVRAAGRRRPRPQHPGTDRTPPPPGSNSGFASVSAHRPAVEAVGALRLLHLGVAARTAPASLEPGAPKRLLVMSFFVR